MFPNLLLLITHLAVLNLPTSFVATLLQLLLKYSLRTWSPVSVLISDKNHQPKCLSKPLIPPGLFIGFPSGFPWLPSLVTLNSFCLWATKSCLSKSLHGHCLEVHCRSHGSGSAPPLFLWLWVRLVGETCSTGFRSVVKINLFFAHFRLPAGRVSPSLPPAEGTGPR